jgi:hypothetical protein
MKPFSFAEDAVSAPGKKRPYEAIAEAEQAWQTGDSSRADELFEKGITAYRRNEPAGLDFALGRYGAFLLDQNRPDEAERVLKNAIELKTDLPAIWSDYIRILADRRDIDAFKSSAETMDTCLRGGANPEFLLAEARRADRQGATPFAEEVARWVVERSLRLDDRDGRWAAIGDLGRILERDGRLEEAMKLWRAAFDEGSCDSETITRLTMNLQRAKDYDSEIRVIREALARRWPANVEESLRKRLAHCEEKVVGKGQRSKKRADVPAYSVRQESALFEPLFQVRLRSSVTDFAVVNSAIRCLLTSRESSTLVEFDLESGSEVRRVENLPLFGSTVFAPDGRGIGVCRTAAVGKGPTILRFLGSDGRLVAESTVPDATSEIAFGPDLWYVGCRNGFLYAFGPDGRQRWAWETPGASTSTDNAYFRPCPYYVSSLGSFAVTASMGDIYGVSPHGKTLWHATIPNEHQTKWNFTVPIPGEPGTREPYAVLGLPFDAPREKVKSAYRHLVLATHPDRNPSDPDATVNFRRIQEAYERILAGHVGNGTTTGTGITFSIEIQGMVPLASFVTATDSGVLVGSSQGRIYIFDGNGNLRDARVLGDSAVRVALRSDGTVGAAWCSDALLFFHDNKMTNAVESVEWPRALTMLGDNVVLWRRNEVRVMDAYGRPMYALEFSKSLAGVVAHGDTLYVAAGVLTAFRRRVERDPSKARQILP